MKPVYIDITKTTEPGGLTGAARQAAETAVKLIESGADIRLTAYSAKDRAYRLIDSDRFIMMFNGLLNDTNEIKTDTLITPSEFEENSVFFDIGAQWSLLPDRSTLLPELKSRRIRIVPMIAGLELIRRLAGADSTELLQFMEYLLAHLRCADEIFVPTAEVKSDVELLFDQLGLEPKPVREVTDLTAELLTDAAPKPKFDHKPVKQVVFLSARPEPILATLPYIEEFMPFITELVVCCPDFMADFMRSCYKGRLRLTTITDGELLAGRPLPPDHSTRNFFLRCLAMEQPAIDDEFIMCDDDSRPLREITEDFFYSEGKYHGYYFSDISTWKYRVNSLFSYDYCHFRTLGFLRSHGYPTLQYSSHMPQLINRQWYLEMIRRYPDIITKGYDEWSTYFNYISAEHSDQYEPRRHVTLSWQRTGGEPMGAPQPDYLFENFYIEDYGEGQVFEGFSTEFTDRETVLAESARKIAISRRFDGRYNSPDSAGHEVAVYCGTSGVRLGVPENISLSRTRKNTVNIGISRAARTEANIAMTIVVLEAVDTTGRICSRCAIDAPPQLEYGHLILDLPGDVTEGLILRAKAWTSLSCIETAADIPVTLTE